MKTCATCGKSYEPLEGEDETDCTDCVIAAMSPAGRRLLTMGLLGAMIDEVGEKETS